MFFFNDFWNKNEKRTLNNFSAYVYGFKNVPIFEFISTKKTPCNRATFFIPAKKSKKLQKLWKIKHKQPPIGFEMIWEKLIRV